MSKGDSGVKLHYTHCRLHSLQQEAFPSQWQATVRDSLLTSRDLLPEPSAAALVLHLARYDEALRDAYLTLEPCVLVQYLFRLCNLTSKALTELPVKGSERPEARVALFAAAKETLARGMRVLGVEPLEQM